MKLAAGKKPDLHITTNIFSKDLLTKESKTFFIYVRLNFRHRGMNVGYWV
jgi:hypothetical protein